jgi:hypothetical protein
MTLDLGRLSAQIQALGAHLGSSRAATLSRLQHARELLQTADRAALAQLAEERDAAARPIEPLDYRAPPTPLVGGYQVLATDGSDIEPDRHGPALCYVLNLGWAVIEYGARPQAELGSAPFLGYLPDDLYVRVGPQQAAIQGSRLGAKRSVAEMQRLAELAATAAPATPAGESRTPRVALSDGLLLFGAYWEGPERFVRDYFVEQVRTALERLAALDVPVAGYVSRPRSADVVELLRLDPRHEAACEACGGAPESPGRIRPECLLEGLSDRLLFDTLAPGERSALFESQRLARHYPASLLPRCFYVNVGREIARVELPTWAAEQPALVARVQTVIVDQCARGQGYPVALARAHEQAVIGGAERQRFRELLARALVQHGLPDRPSEKQASKLSRAV